jgi:50S ribosomal subunit-associated GTPase HflX
LSPLEPDVQQALTLYQQLHVSRLVDSMVDAQLTVSRRCLCSMPVLDRVGLIIEIFAQRAKSREARLQVGPCA